MKNKIILLISVIAALLASGGCVEEKFVPGDYHFVVALKNYEDSAPMAGYDVSLYADEDFQDLVASAVSDDNGEAVFNGVADGDYIVNVEKDGIQYASSEKSFSRLHNYIEFPVNPELLQLAAPKVTLVEEASSYNTLSFRWDFTENEYFDGSFEFELLDQEGQNAVLLQTFNFFGESEWKEKYDRSISFGGLKPSTGYKFRIRAVSTDPEHCNHSYYAILEAGTAAAPQPVEGAVLEEHFDGCIWAGDWFAGTFGLISSTPVSPDKDADKVISLDDSTGDLFNSSSFDPEYVQSILPGWSGSKAYSYLGMLKLGTSSAQGWVQTGKLTAVEGMKNLNLKFKACPYFSFGSSTSSDAKILKIEVIGDGRAETSEIALDNEAPFAMKEYEVVILNATAETQVKIMAAGASKSRFFLDDIVITVDDSEVIYVETDKSEVTFTCDGQPKEENGNIVTVSSDYPWTAETIVEADWLEITPMSGNPGDQITFTCKDENTSQEARVAYVNVTVQSESGKTGVSTVKITQMANTKVPEPEVTVALTESNLLVFRWPWTDKKFTDDTYEFELVEKATGEPVNDVSGQKKLVRNSDIYENGDGTAVTFEGHGLAYGGLKPDTEYTFRVRTISNNDQLEDSEYAECTVRTKAEPDKSGFILYQSFDNFLWGSCFLYDAQGFQPGNMKTATFDSPLVLNDKNDKNTGDIFNSGSVNPEIAKELAPGWSGSCVYMQTGIVLLGTSSKQGWLQTPKLEAISGTQDIVLSFKACKQWITQNDRMKIEVTGGGSAETTSFTLGEKLSLQEYTVKITGATSSTAIKFMGWQAKNAKFYIDDIRIKTE